MDNQTSNKLSEITKISIFSGLKKTQLTKILSHAKTIHCKSGEFLFLDGDKKEKFYILLNGLVKLYITDFNGKEAIIRIVDSGNISDVLEGNFSFNCEILEDSKILTFPLVKFHHIIKENVTLLNNLLSDSFKQNRDLLHQLSTLKLGNGKNKIGQFLLENSIRNGKKTKSLYLSYNKSQIASYLGLRLETFSRLLHQIKDDGEILIQKNKIILTEDKSLCQYCNSSIADKCQLRNQSFCFNKY